MAPIRTLVTKAAIVDNSRADWNGFVDLIAITDYIDLTPTQRPAHLVFWYESEVQNGGHLQYFTNQGLERGEEAIASLDALGAGAYARILEQAQARWRSAKRLPPADALDYVAVALEAEFDDLDLAFGNCDVTLIQVLERHFAKHKDDFVVYE
jgi:hypothetical protein